VELLLLCPLNVADPIGFDVAGVPGGFPVCLRVTAAMSVMELIPGHTGSIRTSTRLEYVMSRRCLAVYQ